jgi:tripeptide aminopeptidase
MGNSALFLGGEGKEFDNQSPNEWFDPTDAYLGTQRTFLTILGWVGFEGVSVPLLPRRR